MAFGDVYGYRTNVSTVVAFAEGDERGFDADGNPTDVELDIVTSVVDLVLTGFASGTARRSDVVVGPEVNQAQTAATINA